MRLRVHNVRRVPSVQIRTESRSNAEQGIVAIRVLGVVVCVWIPETAAAHADALTALFADDDLDDELVSRQLELGLELAFDLIRNLARPLCCRLRVVLLVCKPLLQHGAPM